ncbi:MAG: hypothetical protein VCD66_02750 [Alphaproteobacteria bacterium]
MRPPIIAMAPNSWDDAFWMNRQHLLSRLGARGWDILYSTGRLSFWSRSEEIWRRSRYLSSFKRKNGVFIDVPGKLVPEWPTLPMWEYLGLKIHAAHLRGQRLNGNHGKNRDLILYIFHPKFFPYVKLIKPKFLVYHAYDVFALQGGWSSQLRNYEECILKQADLVIGTTDGIIDAFPGPTRANAVELLNAADTKAFADAINADCPADLVKIPHPRIGYAGRLSVKVNFPMIEEIACRRPDWHWVLLGAVSMPKSMDDAASRRTKMAFAACQNAENVHFLGEKPHLDVPAYAAHMDVNTMCYNSSPGWWTVAYPLKLNEYLATGRAIVSAHLERIAHLDNMIEFADTIDEWEASLERALAGKASGTGAERQAFAAKNSWDVRTDELHNLLHQLVYGSARKQQNVS